MQNDWPTKEKDLLVAQTIIERHLDLNEGEPLGIFDVIVNRGEKVGIQLSDWVVELSEHFSQQYGSEKGNKVIQKVLTGCLLKGETIH